MIGRHTHMDKVNTGQGARLTIHGGNVPWDLWGSAGAVSPAKRLVLGWHP
jgi:hypothetical protein